MSTGSNNSTAAAPALLPNGVQAQAATLEQLQSFARGGFLYAVLDSTDQAKVPEKAQELGADAVSLFQGTPLEEYWAIAPYLFKVSPETLEWIAATLAKEPWGVFVMTRAEFEPLRQHLQHFLVAQLPEGRRTLFRYYDPRVLRTYVPSCNAAEIDFFYGDIRAFAISIGDLANTALFQRANSAAAAAPITAATPLCQMRAEQVQAFQWTTLTEYTESLCTKMGEAFENFNAKSVELKKEVFEQIQKAFGYGFTDQQSAGIYVVTAWLLGKDFDTKRPGALRILTAQEPAKVRSLALRNWAKTLLGGQQ